MMRTGSVRMATSLVLLLFVAISAIAGLLVVVGMLGAFLLPLTLIFLFLLAVYFTGGAGMSGVTIIGGIVVLFLFGYGMHLFLGSTIGYDPIQSSYISGLTAIRLSPLGFNLNDSEFSALLGFVAILAVIAFAFAGLFFQMRARK